MAPEKWCGSGRVPIYAGTYMLADGTVVEVVRAAAGRFYARTGGVYVKGLIYRLRAELDEGVATPLTVDR